LILGEAAPVGLLFSLRAFVTTGFGSTFSAIGAGDEIRFEDETDGEAVSGDLVQPC
jgi:hypothetical protein